jgi:diaminopimelate epimerase
MSKIKFTKMHGAGNDYIYVDTQRYNITNPIATAIEWSKFHTGIGSDGLILVGASDVADFSMRIFNADGSEAMMCGNGCRCVGKFVHDHKLTEKTNITLETRSGIKILKLHIVDGKVNAVTVDMGNPLDIHELEGRTVVSMGNPHLVTFVDNMDDVKLTEIGPKLEHHPHFADRTNVEFAQIVGKDKIRMRVWERGSGITQACGTGACATAVAAASNNLTSRRSEVIMDGGSVIIEWDEKTNTVLMTGPATTVFEGEIDAL